MVTCGRLWDWVTPRSASSSATGLDVIEEPRSAWMVSWPRLMPCLRAGRGDQLLGQDGGLAGGDHPADGIPAEDVEDHVQVVVGPLRRAVQLGDVPRVHLVRPGGCELGLDGSGMRGLPAALPALARLAQHPVVGGYRAEVGALVQQRGPCLGRGGVGEPLRVQRVEDGLPFGCRQRTGLRPVPLRHGCRARRRRGWPGAAGTRWPAARRPPRTPPGCRFAARAGRSPRRSRIRPGPGVRALGDRLQERLQF